VFRLEVKPLEEDAYQIKLESPHFLIQSNKIYKRLSSQKADMAANSQPPTPGRYRMAA
jgi:hypothetical protein